MKKNMKLKIAPLTTIFITAVAILFYLVIPAASNFKNVYEKLDGVKEIIDRRVLNVINPPEKKSKKVNIESKTKKSKHPKIKESIEEI